jgi:splicing factor 3B subunit 3
LQHFIVMTESKLTKTVSHELKLLDLTLKHASAIQMSLMGEFTAPNSPELLLVRPGGALEVYRVEQSDDDEEGRVWLKMVMRVDTRSVIRSVETIRLAGEKRDLIIVGSDSGNVSVLDFEGAQSKILYCPAFGKTGKHGSTMIKHILIYSLSLNCFCTF